MRNLPVVFILLMLLTSCWPAKEKDKTSVINTAHLNHLYKEIVIGDTVRLGTVWIYCEAPDYRFVGDEDEGFTCVDDVARALVFYCRQYGISPDTATLAKIRTMTAFLLFMQAENGYFYNFIFPNGQINKDHINSRAVASWWSWRAFWALSEFNLLSAPALSDLQQQSRQAMDGLFTKMKPICAADTQQVDFEGIAVPQCLAELGADQAAVMVVALTNYYRIHPEEDVRKLILTLGNQLLRVQYGDSQTPPFYAFLSWQNYWHAWGNSQAYALLYAGRRLQHRPFVDAGLNEVRYFYPFCIDKGFVHEFKLTKKDGRPTIEAIKPFTQIAYDISPMILAAVEAYAITNETTYAHIAEQLAGWFEGKNAAKQAMYDSATGRAYDGINSASDINRNSGAESTIEALLSLQALEVVNRQRQQ